jgi:hypothetical protein
MVDTNVAVKVEQVDSPATYGPASSPAKSGLLEVLATALELEMHKGDRRSSSFMHTFGRMQETLRGSGIAPGSDPGAVAPAAPTKQDELATVLELAVVEQNKTLPPFQQRLEQERIQQQAQTHQGLPSMRMSSSRSVPASTMASATVSSTPAGLSGEELYNWQQQLQHQQRQLNFHHQQLQHQQQAQHAQQQHLEHQHQQQQQTHAHQKQRGVTQQTGQDLLPPLNGARASNSSLPRIWDDAPGPGQNTAVQNPPQNRPPPPPQTSPQKRQRSVGKQNPGAIVETEDPDGRKDGRKHRGGRRRKEDYMDVAQTYQQLYTRVMDIPQPVRS